MPYITTRSGWKGLGAAMTQAQYDAMTPAQRQALAMAVATGINIATGVTGSGAAGASVGLPIAMSSGYAAGLATPSQGIFAVAKDGKVSWGSLFSPSSQSAPIKVTSTQTGTAPEAKTGFDFGPVVDILKQMTGGSAGAGVLPSDYKGPVIAPNLLAQMQPAPQSSFPGWILPVGLGVLALGAVVFLVTRKW